MLVGAVLLTPGRPDCVAYTAADHVLCPWYRAFLRNAAFISAVITVVIVLVGLPVGLVRELLGGRG